MEVWDIFDCNKKPVKYGQNRKIPLFEGEFFYGVGCWIITKEKKILITKRALHKFAGGTFENSGGAVNANEESIKAIQREVKEETNINLNPEKLFLIEEVKLEHCFFDTYAAIVDIDNEIIKLQENETIDYKLVSFEELVKIAESNLMCEAIKERFQANKYKIAAIIEKID